jgi:hypothetical protein
MGTTDSFHQANLSSSIGARIRTRIITWLSGRAGFLVSATLFLAGHLGFFLTMRSRSLAWAPGHIWDSFFQYPTWRHGKEFAVRALLQADPGLAVTGEQLWQLATLALIVLGYVGILLGCLAPGVSRRRVGPVVVLVAVASAILLVLPNLLSGDIHSYIMYGRIDLLHGGNSLLEAPARYIADPFLQWVHWKREPSVYGPAWLYVGMGVTWLAERLGGTIVVYTLLFKLLAAALHFGSAGLIWKLLGRVAPQRQAFGTLFYLANPLALIEFVGQGHNDVTMVFLMLVGIWLGYQKRWQPAVIAFTLAVFTKWTAGVALLFYAIVAVREASPAAWGRWKRLAGVGVLVAVTTVALYARFWEGSSSITLLTRSPPQKLMANSMSALIVDLRKGTRPVLVSPEGALHAYRPDLAGNVDGNMDRSTGEPPAGYRMGVVPGPEDRRGQAVARDLTQTAILAALALGAATVSSMGVAVVAAAWVLFFVCFLAVWFWPWYATWFFSIAPVAGSRALMQLALVFSSLGLAIYPLRYSYLRTVVVFVPTAALTLYFGIRWARAWWIRQHQVALPTDLATGPS